MIVVERHVANRSINRILNQIKADITSFLGINRISINRFQKITLDCTKQVANYQYCCNSKLIIDRAVRREPRQQVSGYNTRAKQQIEIDKLSDRKFADIPHRKMVQLQYKVALSGIEVKLTDESYTAKTSFLDKDSVSKHQLYQGYQVKRGLFGASWGKVINAPFKLAFITKLSSSIGGWGLAFGKDVFASDSIEAFAVAPVRDQPLRIHKMQKAA